MLYFVFNVGTNRKVGCAHFYRETAEQEVLALSSKYGTKYIVIEVESSTVIRNQRRKGKNNV